MKFFTKIKGILAGLAILGMALTPIQTSKAADGPRFNFLDGDNPVIYGLNLTKGETERKTTSSGTAGDVFEIAMYYHNGMVNTTAHDTKLKVNLPSQTTNGSAILRGTISADNADAVTGDMALKLNTDSSLAFVPGTLRWYPNYQNGSPSVAIPAGDKETDLFSANGLNVGNINGCWDYKGYVLFQVRTTKLVPVITSIARSKIAKNLTTGQSGTNILANPGDLIQYTLTTTNTGTIPVNIKPVADDISDILEYADIASLEPNSLVVNGIVTFNNNLAEQIIAPGIVSVNSFKVKVKSPLPLNPQSGYHFDFVMFNIYGNSVTVNLPRPIPGTPVLKMQKDVRDATASENNFVDSDQAKPGDTLEYKISWSNNGQGTVNGVTVNDTLPLHTQYLSGTTVISHNGGAEQALPDTLTTASGVSIGNINPNDSGYIKFKVLTSSALANEEQLVNTAYLKFGSLSLTDTATTKIIVGPLAVTTVATVTPTQPSLPKTGAESWVIALLVVPAGFVLSSYLKRKKIFKAKLANY